MDEFLDYRLSNDITYNDIMQDDVNYPEMATLVGAQLSQLWVLLPQFEEGGDLLRTRIRRYLSENGFVLELCLQNYAGNLMDTVTLNRLRMARDQYKTYLKYLRFY
jgi:hypothetical protein